MEPVLASLGVLTVVSGIGDAISYLGLGHVFVANMTAAYFVVAEALTNVVKHAKATYARVTATFNGAGVELTVTDDGLGGADPSGGSGLVGLRDRVAARDGTLELHSPPGEGTTLRVWLPVS